VVLGKPKSAHSFGRQLYDSPGTSAQQGVGSMALRAKSKPSERFELVVRFAFDCRLGCIDPCGLRPAPSSLCRRRKCTRRYERLGLSKLRLRIRGAFGVDIDVGGILLDLDCEL
jgi:hypothetical protein